MDIIIMTPVITNLKSTGWMTFGDSVRDSISQYVKNEIVPVMKEAGSDLLLEVDSIYSPSNQERPGFCITFIINRDNPSYFKIESDNMMILRAVEEIMREIVISDDDNESSKLINEMKGNDKKIKCVVRKIEMMNKMLPYSSIYIPSTDNDLIEAVGNTVIISTQAIKVGNDNVRLGSSMSVAVDTYMENDGTYCEPDDGFIYVSSDVYNSLGLKYDDAVRIFYNLDSDNIKKEFPELFECDTTPFTHHYKMRRKVSFIRDAKDIDNRYVIYVDKYDPIVTTEGVAQPIHMNKLNEIPTVSCFIKSDDRYMMRGCIGVSKYIADMMSLKNGQIVEIDIIVHSDNPVKKHSFDFETLGSGEYESTSSKGLHIEPEIRNDKFTTFSICKDQSDKQEEETSNETD